MNGCNKSFISNFTAKNITNKRSTLLNYNRENGTFNVMNSFQIKIENFTILDSRGGYFIFLMKKAFFLDISSTYFFFAYQNYDEIKIENLIMINNYFFGIFLFLIEKYIHFFKTSLKWRMHR